MSITPQKGVANNAKLESVKSITPSYFSIKVH